MMYFLVVMPPKVLIMVRPACFAMSVKYAGGVGAVVCGLSTARRMESGSRMAKTNRRSKEDARRWRGFEKTMPSTDSRVWAGGGQGCLPVSPVGVKREPLR